ncbi:hypothetical protein BaRGS_00009190 [Batillaria attramentaria]|uniref:Uncharacterized protein n=1 Tax=Batillaria attramentaria TaxID=370345 RepID=A0ABD0LJD6_9CAEN
MRYQTSAIPSAVCPNCVRTGCYQTGTLALGKRTIRQAVCCTSEGNLLECFMGRNSEATEGGVYVIIQRLCLCAHTTASWSGEKQSRGNVPADSTAQI